MKRIFFIMTMAMFIVMLSMTGCSQEGEDNKPPKSISLEETLTLDMQVNKTVTLTATIVNGTQKDTVTWSSGDTTNEFVSITPNGLSCTVTAIKATSTPVTITAALAGDSGIKATCSVTVRSVPEGKYISFSRTTLELDTQNSKTYTLIATIGRGSAGDTVTWSSSDTTNEFVSITPNGLSCTVTAIKATSTPVIITAALANDSAIKNTCSVTVSAEAVILKSITLDQTTLELDTKNTMTATLTAAIVNGAQGDTVRWSSGDTTGEFVSIIPDGLSCTVTVKRKATVTPVIITAALSSDAGIRAMCEVTVTFIPLELKLSTTATTSSVPHANAKNQVTTTLPDPVANIYTVNSGYDSGNWTSGSIFTDTTFVYIDKLITGDFKIRARVQVGSFPAGTASSRGMMLGGFKPDDEGKLAVNSSTAALFLQGNGEVRKALPRDGSPASLGGSTINVTRATEFIYEFQRSGGFTSAVYISKNGEALADPDSTYGYNNGGINYEIQADTPVYAGVALLCVEDVKISQLELWIDGVDGDPVFYSGASAAAEVKVETVSLGVQGGTVGTEGTNPGSAGNPATYVVKASAVTASGIQLVPAFVPAYADNKSVNYSKTEGDTTLDINTTGKVTVTGVGTATFRVQSVSKESAEYYLKITATADYMPIEDFNITGSLITGSSNTLTVNRITRLTTNISPQIIAASNPNIVWTASSPAVKFVVNGTEANTATGNLVSIKGVSANAAVTITATATTQDGANAPDTKTATTSIEVKALSGVFFEWNAGDGWDNNYTSLKGVPTKKTSAASGTVIDTDGSIKMPFNNRWVLGVGTDAVQIGGGTLGAGNANYAENAAFNLSKTYKLTIELSSTLDGTGAELTIALNTEGGSNNGGPISGSAGGVIGDAVPALGCMIFQRTAASLSPTRTTLSVTVEPSLFGLHNNASNAGLTMGEIIGNQFMQFRINNNGAGQVNIYKIKLEYVD